MIVFPRKIGSKKGGRGGMQPAPGSGGAQWSMRIGKGKNRRRLKDNKRGDGSGAGKMGSKAKASWRK